MGGKAAILLVLGFSLIFLVAGNNFNRLSTSAVDNSTNYYVQSYAYNIASSAANIAANNVYLNPSWNGSFSNVSFAGGKMSAYIHTIDPIQNIREIVATGVYFDSTKTIKIKIQPGRFSQFAYYSVNEPSDICSRDIAGLR